METIEEDPKLSGCKFGIRVNESPKEAVKLKFFRKSLETVRHAQLSVAGEDSVVFASGASIAAPRFCQYERLLRSIGIGDPYGDCHGADAMSRCGAINVITARTIFRRGYQI